MGTIKVSSIILVLLLCTDVLSKNLKDSNPCDEVQCHPIQCPADSRPIFKYNLDSINLENDEDYDSNVVDDEPDAAGDYVDVGILHDVQGEDDENVVVEHQTRKYVHSGNFYVEPSEKGEDEENRTLVKRSLQYKRRESIKIVPGDYKSFIPDDGRYHGYNHNHHKWKREVRPEVNATEVNTTESGVSTPCCPEQVCICRGKCPIPDCPVDQVLIEVKPGNRSIPGECCTVHECSPEPDCKSLSKDVAWTRGCRSCQCHAGQTICHDSCTEEEPSQKMCFYNSRHHHDGDWWLDGGCTQCQCINGETKCTAYLCGKLECRNPKRIEGECCPVCADTTTSESSASTNNQDSSTATITNTSTISTFSSTPASSSSSVSTTTGIRSSDQEESIENDDKSTVVNSTDDCNRNLPAMGQNDSAWDEILHILLYVASAFLICICAFLFYLWYKEKNRKYEAVCLDSNQVITA